MYLHALFQGNLQERQQKRQERDDIREGAGAKRGRSEPILDILAHLHVACACQILKQLRERSILAMDFALA